MIISDGCEYSLFLGDGICDDDLNSEDCFYDEGDCCKNVESAFEICTECKCNIPILCEFLIWGSCMEND